MAAVVALASPPLLSGCSVAARLASLGYPSYHTRAVLELKLRIDGSEEQVRALIGCRSFFLATAGSQVTRDDGHLFVFARPSGEVALLNFNYSCATADAAIGSAPHSPAHLYRAQSTASGMQVTRDEVLPATHADASVAHAVVLSALATMDTADPRTNAKTVADLESAVNAIARRRDHRFWVAMDALAITLDSPFVTAEDARSLSAMPLAGRVSSDTHRRIGSRIPSEVRDAARNGRSVDSSLSNVAFAFDDRIGGFRPGQRNSRRSTYFDVPFQKCPQAGNPCWARQTKVRLGEQDIPIERVTMVFDPAARTLYVIGQSYLP
ncbi:MAG TPA: hypothetical protein VFZ28_08450 [Burkholderiaceae bacterium]|nr:hypothetical protein [Burkholderiaceae bacterium]